MHAATKRSQPAPYAYVHYHSYSAMRRHSFPLLFPVLHSLHPSGATWLVKCPISITRAHSTTQNNSTSPSQPSTETYKHYTPRLRQHSPLYAPQHRFMRPINQLTAPACTVSAAATQGPALTQSRHPPTSACPTQISFAVVNFAAGPQALTPASQPRPVTVVTCKQRHRSCHDVQEA